tara:strand:- start:47 stop:184 length:138 start_codon:yes stop_codon:yes gene_type:complete
MGKQDKKLINNLERYEEEKTKQQESKIHGQKPVKGKSGKEKNIVL